ncbi:MAG TPA: YcxB family protein [Cytophagales bacterium]|nr:YcxB family protein [Cytophagales bacterium]
MIIKTKKYKLETKTYIKLGLLNILKEQWWVFLIAVGIAALTIFYPETIWFYIIAGVALVLYILFWVIQFAGVTQMEQNKILFEKLSYEIDSRQILIKLNPKQGMPMTWDKIKSASKLKDAFILVLSKAQFIHLPFKIFNSENEIKFMEAILKRKNYIKEAKGQEVIGGK